MNLELRRAFHSGVMAALAVVYQADQETLAEEIVGLCDEAELLKVARAEDDPWLPNLRRTVRVLRHSRKAIIAAAKREESR